MAFTLDTPIKEIRKSPEAKEAIDKIIPGFATDPKMKLVGGMSFNKLGKIPQAKMTEDKLAAIEKVLAELD
ncbi:MAG: hypothetical protein FWD27_05465 [Coriobacteriia bacterium]|nr:hypothetical protein [Coriobacteriia bacterium]